jgi:S-adenosylmethionine hydrolase
MPVILQFKKTFILVLLCVFIFIINTFSLYSATTKTKPVVKKQQTVKEKAVNNSVSEEKKISKDTIDTSKKNSNALVFMTDFGVKDGAVAAMKGVAFSIDQSLPLFDLTHEITPYDIWEGANRLQQVVTFWPKGTVFVAVVDPGVGTKRKPVVLKTKSGHYFVGPNNGLFTIIFDSIGVEEMREIDETKNRLPNSYESYTFHGRDLFAYVGAMLASDKLKFENIGDVFEVNNLVLLEYTVGRNNKGAIIGTISALDTNYGNVWSNISKKIFDELNPEIGKKYRVKITNGDSVYFDDNIPYYQTFGAVDEGQPLLYINSLLQVAIALNMDSFASTYKISYGPAWKISITPEYNSPYKSNPTPPSKK